MSLADVGGDQPKKPRSRKGSATKEQDGRYGKVEFAPTCPHCSRDQKKDVALKVTKTSGPIVYYHCDTEDCSFTTKAARPWKPDSFAAKQRDLRAREDM